MGTPPVRLSEAQRDDLDRLNLALAQADILPCDEDNRAIHDDPRVQAQAAPACSRCPILDQCRAYGLAWPLEVGLYGGLTHAQRLHKPRAPRKRTPKEPPSPEEIERRRALVRERSRRARARKKQRQNGEIAC